MTTFPTRGQQAPDYWDDELKAYIDERAATTANIEANLPARLSEANIQAAISAEVEDAVTLEVTAHAADNDAHGVLGVIVGTESLQTLVGKTISLGSNTVVGTKAQFDAACIDADFVTTDGVETLTNKAVDLADNTLVGTKAQFNAALTDGDFVTTEGPETMSGKTINLSTINLSTLNSCNVNSPTIKDPAYVNTTGWTAFTPTWVDATIGNGVVIAKARQEGNLLHFRARITMGSTTTYRSTIVVSVPFLGAADYALGDPLGVAYMQPGGPGTRFAMNVGVEAAPASGATRLFFYGESGAATPTFPAAWGSGGVLSFSGTMELKV